jgi:small-conductance mechanosensitive channel
MPLAPALDASGVASLLMAGLVLAAAAFLGWRQWRDVRSRPPALSPRDEGHFARQDLRRLLGTIILVLIAAAMALGAWIPDRVGGRINQTFVNLWAGVALMMVVLLVLALLDWISTRVYARRLRRRLTDEGLSIVEDELRARIAMQKAQRHREGTNGHPPASED